ncbi:MAG: hypothetical protein ACE148_01925 [Vicinamibacterales bacterium]
MTNISLAEDKLLRIQGEYLEMPGLRLTPAQAQRLWGLDRAECEWLMSLLVRAQFLTVTRDGSYVRVDQNSVTPEVSGHYPSSLGIAKPEKRGTPAAMRRL